jgi:hypothetical protein
MILLKNPHFFDGEESSKKEPKKDSLWIAPGSIFPDHLDLFWWCFQL